jgi:ATP-binding cassette subfamily F protein 3
MRDALALALQAYAGAVLIVAHDRDLLEKIVDELWVVEAGGLHSYSGDLNQYTAGRLSLTSSAQRVDNTHAGDMRSKKEQRRERAASRQSLSHLRKEVRALEAQLEENTTDLQRLETTLADEKTYSELPPDELTELLTQAGAKRQTLERVEEQWLEAVAKLESHDEN